MDRTNLLYNGDFSSGLDSWHDSSGDSRLSVASGVLTANGGDLYQDINYAFPIAANRTYRITYDLKINVKDTYPFYIALRPRDNAKTLITRASVYHPISGCNTTLAAALNNGDTTVTLTDGSKWPTSRTNQLIGICDKLAWGYNRCTKTAPYSTKDGNVIILKSAWSGGSYAAGTKVSEFEYGSTYDYPQYISNANLPTEWQTYTCTFSTDTLMYSCQYVQFGTLGYGMNYSMRNIKVECIDDIQSNHFDKYKVDLTKQGVLKSSEFNDIGMPIRYVRDTINGSTANTANHWCEFEVYNYVGENIAWGKDVKLGTTTHSNSVATDGIINNSYIQGNPTLTFDIGYIENIHKIKIWHYYPDGRTYYNNVTEVSVDGVNWYTVYSGQKPETAAGNEIILSANKTLFKKNGEVFANELIEL